VYIYVCVRVRVRVRVCNVYSYMCVTGIYVYVCIFSMHYMFIVEQSSHMVKQLCL